jgi:hypothetical protein
MFVVRWAHCDCQTHTDRAQCECVWLGGPTVTVRHTDTAQCECLWLGGSTVTVTHTGIMNSEINFQCKMPIWFKQMTVKF